MSPGEVIATWAGWGLIWGWFGFQWGFRRGWRGMSRRWEAEKARVQSVNQATIDRVIAEQRAALEAEWNRRLEAGPSL